MLPGCGLLIAGPLLRCLVKVEILATVPAEEAWGSEGRAIAANLGHR